MLTRTETKGPRWVLLWRILLGVTVLIVWTLLILAGYAGYSRMSAEWNDYKAVKAIMIYNLQQGKLAMPQPPATPQIPQAPNRPPDATPPPKPAEGPKK